MQFLFRFFIVVFVVRTSVCMWLCCLQHISLALALSLFYSDECVSFISLCVDYLVLVPCTGTDCKPNTRYKHTPKKEERIADQLFLSTKYMCRVLLSRYRYRNHHAHTHNTFFLYVVAYLDNHIHLPTYLPIYLPIYFSWKYNI